MGARSRIVTALKSIPLLPVLVSLLIGLLVVFLAVGGFDDPAWVDRFFGPAEKFRVLEFLGVAMGGVLLAIGAVIAHKRAVALEEAAKAQARAAEAQADAAKRQADANKGAEDGRRQERLKNAIEHLGHASDSVRLGGAYELFHLAQDTEDLRQTVLDILCAHIRRTTGEDGYRERYKSKPSEEVQSLLTLLFIREYAIFEGFRVDLQGSWLNGAVLRRARLEEANLSQSHLQKAEFSEAWMPGVDLSGAHMQGVYLVDTYMQKTNLFRSDLRGSVLLGPHLEEANLRDSYLQGVVFSRPYLQSANLIGAHLQGASLHGARLQDAILADAHLQGALLPRVLLQGASLNKAHLQGAYLFDAELQGASLLGAHLQGTTCELTEESSYAARIHARIGRESDLSEVMFTGGLSRGDLDSFIEGIPDEVANRLRRRLEPHIGKPASYEPPEGSGAILGTYTAAEAARWIAEYEEAMRGVPKAERG